MARLVLKAAGMGDQVILLRLGVNRLGRGGDNDFPIDHPTVSSKHCEIEMSPEGLRVKDCHSTNGTFLNGSPITEATLQPGQVLRLGDVELVVEDTEVKVDIPKFDVPRPAPPIVAVDGSVMCRRHEDQAAAYQCTHCLELLCKECVHKLRRRRGKTWILCPLCSHTCEPLGAIPKPKKRKLLGFLLKTVKLPSARGNPRD